MKKNILLIKTALVLFPSISLFAQTNQDEGFGEEYKHNTSKENCLTQQQRFEIISMLQKNVNELKKEGKLNVTARTTNHVLFDWPIKKADHSNFTNVWGISNYVDHNPSYPNQVTDFDCGNKTYDTNTGYNHQGTDIYIWPFSWKQVDDGTAEIVAAAEGTIIGKIDGNYDRNCSFNSSNWNAVYVMHTDGSIAWYGHMKKNSLTSKPVGSTVSRGEFLGHVGSSGNSTGPHLHFEVYADQSYTKLIDPYQGTCNSLNTDSWWVNQKPHTDGGINLVSTHFAHPQFPTCPTTEIPNFSDRFSPGDPIFFYTFLKDQVAGSTLYYRLYRPDGSIHAQYNQPLNNNYASAYWWWTRSDLTILGQWKLQFTYNNKTVDHYFYVETLGTNDMQQKAFKIHPNPTSDVIKFDTDNTITQVQILDLTGKLVEEVTSKESIKEVKLKTLPKGTYIVVALDNKGNKFTEKVIRK